MSKCQRNKYFLGTPPSEKKCNPEFQSSMSKLLSDREKQDLQFSLPLHSSQQQPSQQQPQSHQSQQIVVKQPQKQTQKHQTSRFSDITTILSGDTTD
jgi:hypothetical protein